MKKWNEEESDGEEGKASGDRWLLTYSDMITLLLALFIIMYGMSSIDTGKFKQMTQGLESALNNPTTSAGQGTENNELEQVYEELNKYIVENAMSDTVNLSKTNNTVVVHMKDTVLFQPDTATLLPGSETVLKEISNIISSVYNKVDHVTITGNTADVGRNDPANEADSWQLSVDRAVKVLNSLTSAGLAPGKLSIEGNSHYDPVATNDTEAGRAKNRRVEITITKNSPAAAASSSEST